MYRGMWLKSVMASALRIFYFLKIDFELRVYIVSGENLELQSLDEIEGTIVRVRM